MVVYRPIGIIAPAQLAPIHPRRRCNLIDPRVTRMFWVTNSATQPKKTTVWRWIDGGELNDERPIASAEKSRRQWSWPSRLPSSGRSGHHVRGRATVSRGSPYPPLHVITCIRGLKPACASTGSEDTARRLAVACRYPKSLRRPPESIERGRLEEVAAADSISKLRERSRWSERAVVPCSLDLAPVADAAR